MSHNHRKEVISKLRGRAQELEAKLEGLTKSLMLKPGLYMAMSDREAIAPNELSMQKFQSVRVIMAYSDGWGSCVNEDTGEKGVVPLSCLKSMDGFQVSEQSLSDHQLEMDKKLLKKLSISDDILVKEPGIYTCVQDRMAERVNELSLEKGNEVRVLMVFSDGWGLCLVESTGEQGIAPLNILKLQGFNIDLLHEQIHQSTSKAIGYYRVSVDRIPIQPNEVLLVKGNVVMVSTIYSDGWCHCMNIDTMDAGDCPLNVLEWIEGQSLSKDLRSSGNNGKFNEQIHGTAGMEDSCMNKSYHYTQNSSERAEILHPIIELESEFLMDTKDALYPVLQEKTSCEEQNVPSKNCMETEMLEQIAVKKEKKYSNVTESVAVNSIVQQNDLIDFDEEVKAHPLTIEVIHDSENETLRDLKGDNSVVEESTDDVREKIDSFTQSAAETEAMDIMANIKNTPLETYPGILGLTESNDEKTIMEEMSELTTNQKHYISDNNETFVRLKTQLNDQCVETQSTDSKLQSELELKTAETLADIRKDISVFPASIGDIPTLSEHSMKRVETFNVETDSDITLSHSPSFENSQLQMLHQGETLFDSTDALILGNGLKFIEIKSSATISSHNVAATKKSFVSKVQEKLPHDSQDIISILRLIRMISIFLLAVQFLGFVCYSLANAFLILKNQITSIMPVAFTAQEIYIWLTYIFIDILEIDRFPVVSGNTLAIIALIATVWEGVLIGFVNQIMA